jgi:glycosyltransferase involved in cell wall biosynthesis
MLAARLIQTLKKLQPDLVHYDSVDLALFEPATSGLRRVLNHHNCESAMMERRAENEPNPLKKLYLRSQAGKLARVERDICSLFDVNLAVSELDANTIKKRAPTAHFHIVENGTDTTYFTPLVGQEEPASIIFAASMRFYPNAAAVRFLVSKIWPLIKARRPAARLYLAGQGSPEWMLRLGEADPNIQVVPTPEDMRPWVARASVFLCPILDGGGTKLKILDAMAMGKAVVSTSIGCEGLQVSPGKNILVADTPEDFATAVHNLLGDAALRQCLATAGRKLVEEKYSWEAIRGRLEGAYRCTLETRPCNI